MATAQEIADAAESSVNFQARRGCFLLRPPVKLTFEMTGEVVNAIAVDINGKYPNTVRTTEKGFWIYAGEFDIVQE